MKTMRRGKSSNWSSISLMTNMAKRASYTRLQLAEDVTCYGVGEFVLNQDLSKIRPKKLRELFEVARAQLVTIENELAVELDKFEYKDVWK